MAKEVKSAQAYEMEIADLKEENEELKRQLAVLTVLGNFPTVLFLTFPMNVCINNHLLLHCGRFEFNLNTNHPISCLLLNTIILIHIFRTGSVNCFLCIATL